MPGTMAAPESGVTVRMYRPGGLGDCFLLAFRGDDGQARTMMIDCGVFTGTRGQKDRMKEILADVHTATDGHLDVLAVSHEHWDHVAGFYYARDEFDALSIGEIWLAWTEDLEHDAQAKRLRESRGHAMAALGAAVNRLAAAGDPAAEEVTEVLRFFGEPQALGATSRRRRGTSAQMEYVRMRPEHKRFCDPADPPFAFPDASGARIYVLGPPRNEALLTRSNPSRRASEVYEDRHALTGEAAFYSAAISAATEPEKLSRQQRELAELSRPFDDDWGIPLGKVAGHPLHGDTYSARYGSDRETEEGAEDSLAWRRIETDWLGAAGSLALKLDSDTNNTSLALAIELVGSGRVLIFPADAQVGNWLSWHDHEWSSEGRAVKAEDLLERTVLYKVGHHASHNATLSDRGLELMTHPDLVALMPVHQAQAERKRWEMPFPPLMERLGQKTRGRILRADHGLPDRSPDLSAADWREFQEQTRETDLWVQITIPDR